MNCSEIRNNVEFWKNLNHNFLVIRCEEDEESYETEMLKNNKIEHFLSVETRVREGREDLCYEISSMQPLNRIYKSGMMGYEELKNILSAVPKAYEAARKYMLNEERILLNPELIYVDMETKSLKFIYFPFYEEKESIKFSDFSEYLLQAINHLDSDAVYLGYRFYKLVRRENFVIREISELINEDLQKNVKGKEKDFNFMMADSLEEEPEDKDLYVCPHKPEDKKSQKTDVKRKSFLPGILLVLLPSIALLFGWISFKRNIKMGMIAMSLIVIGAVWTAKKIRSLKEEGEEKEAEDGAKERAKEIVERKEAEERKKEEKQEYPEKFIWTEEGDYSGKRIEEEEEEYGKTVFMEAPETDYRRVLVEKRRGKEHVLSEFPISVGKVKECVDIVLPDKSVSRLHAQIFQREKKIYIKDCNSTNGTRINGLLLNAEEDMILEDEDEIRIGNVSLVYREQ